MTAILLVGTGGALGSVGRYLLSSYAFRQWGSLALGTFAVNAIGCLVVGLVAGLALGRTASPQASLARLFLVTGFCGGFTTFSAFGLDVVDLARTGHVALAAANAIGQVIVSVAAVAIGIAITRA